MRNRLITIDLFKTLALLLMFANHLLTLLYQPSGDLPYLFARVFQVSILASSLFLFSAGFILIYQRLTLNTTLILGWQHNKALSALLLIGLSALIYPFHHDQQLHYFSTGILQTIGVLKLITLVFLSVFPVFLWLPGILVAVGLAVILNPTLVGTAISIDFINAYEFPLIPFASYFGAGCITATIYFYYRNQIFWLYLITLLTLSSCLGFLWTFSLSLIDVFRLEAILYSYRYPDIWFNLFQICLLLGICILLLTLEPLLKTNKVINTINILGEHSLVLYVVHLIVLGTIRFAGFRLETELGVYLAWLLLVIGGFLVSLVRSRSSRYS